MSSRIERAYRLALGRAPSERELRIAIEFLARSEDAGDGASASPEEAWALVVPGAVCDDRFSLYRLDRYVFSGGGGCRVPPA